ncbi:Acetoin dehydrogenase operon transcriptional activator AcoR [Pelotomaculum sp. FP]|uniref:sigma-54-dependent Fis family transcriptional regulator n=1 Tax=Pelotomaculum sp. FP TaxID=261474 RepID=UPI0010FFD81E|nr:sigma-54-dependent Fis family transcriptional regulator [Pelotomaculum sp. FP]TEB17878.1 Acetoin dehydrogenase operon transcriptional activator AcoR [Pelotomaculum sp. FP]
MADYAEDSKDMSHWAWRNFVKTGVIAEQGVQPIIARSWQRSRNIDTGIDPIHNDLVLSKGLLEEKRADNQDLISIAAPIMRDICYMGGENFVSLSDADGYVFDAVSNVDCPIPLGATCREEVIGANGIGIALVEDKLVEIRRYEHYLTFLHEHGCAAITLHNPDGQIIGTINITNPFGDLEPGSSGLLQLGTQVIERQLRWKYSMQKEALSTFGVLKDEIGQCLLVFDQHGKIIDVNKNCINLLRFSREEEILGVHFRDILKENNAAGTIIPHPGTKFELVNDLCSVPCKAVKNSIIRGFNDSDKTLLLFETVNSVNKGPNKLYFTFNNIIGKAQSWSNIVHRAKKAAEVSSNVLIEGESGTGKELIAQSIHTDSGRSGLFVPINCGAIPKELIESELFGYEEGAFTGARKGGMKGKLEMADKGTLFLDEIGEMPLAMQVHLLRFLQDKTVTRMGGTKPKTVDIRVIAATNRDLRQEVKEGRFREDLYFRLNVINIQLPPLRRRKEDIPMLVHYFMNKFCQEFKKPPLDIDSTTINALCRYDWPGNVRELSNIIENGVIFTEGKIMAPEVLPSYVVDYKPINPLKENNLKIYEKALILETLEKCEGNVTKTAKALGIARNTLYNKLRKL